MPIKGTYIKALDLRITRCGLTVLAAAAVFCFISTAFTASSAFAAKLDYEGMRVYPQFTRVVFGTPDLKPESYNIRYDELNDRVVVFVSGGIGYTFKPVRGKKGTVKDVDYIQLPDSSIGVVLRLDGNALGFRVSYLHGPARLVIDIYRDSDIKPFMPISRRVNTIVIDPGHGGEQSGASRGTDSMEKDIVVDVALRLSDKLTRLGYQTVVTRTGDAEADMTARAGLANNAKGDLFISLHASAGFGVRASQRGVYVMDEGPLDGDDTHSGSFLWSGQQAAYLPDSLRLAGEIKGRLSSLGGGSVAMKDIPVYGFNGLAMPAAIVEIGTLGELADEGFRDAAAEALSKAINSYASGVTR